MLLMVVIAAPRVSAQVCQEILFTTATYPPEIGIDADLLALATQSPGDVRLLNALGHALQIFTPEAADTFTRTLIDPSDLTSEDKSFIANNPYLTERQLVRSEVLGVNLILARDLFGERLSEYELGLLASLLPSSRTPGRRKLFLDVKRSQLHDESATLFARADYRAAVASLFKATAERPLMMLHMLEFTPTTIKPMIRSTIEDLMLDLTDRLLGAKLKRHDQIQCAQVTICVYMAALSSQILEEASLGRFDQLDARLSDDWNRDQVIQSSESYLLEKLKLSHSIDHLRTVFGVLAYGDPIPSTAAIIQTHVLTGARALVRSLRRRLNGNVDAPEKPLPPLTLKPYEFKPKDLYAPPAPSKPARFSLAIQAKPRLPVESPVSDDDLIQFTARGEAPRTMTSLQAKRRYRFTFARAQNQAPQKVVFSAEAREWLVENPAIGRQILNALILGRGHGTMSGLKLLNVRSRHHDGVIFEIKNRSSYRGLVIREGDVWQVLAVAHKDHLDQTVLSLKPMDL